MVRKNGVIYGCCLCTTFVIDVTCDALFCNPGFDFVNPYTKIELSAAGTGGFGVWFQCTTGGAVVNDRCDYTIETSPGVFGGSTFHGDGMRHASVLNVYAAGSIHVQGATCFPGPGQFCFLQGVAYICACNTAPPP